MKIIQSWLLIGVVLGSNLLAESIYDKAMSVMAGERDVVVKTIKINNCPYERCSDRTKNLSEVKINLSNKGKGLALFVESLRIEKDEKSALAIIMFLSKQIDYKSSAPNAFLVKKMKKDIGISIDDYSNLIKEAISFLISKKNCAGYYWLYKFSENGFIYKKDDFFVTKLEEGKAVCEKGETTMYSISYKSLM